jgi:FkbM family methyltransferase
VSTESVPPRPRPWRVAIRRAIATAALPAIRLEVPGKDRIMNAVGVFEDTLWVDAPRRTVRCKGGVGRVELDLSEQWERRAFFLARYHELPLLRVMDVTLRPGDVFVDVGANLGLVSLYGAELVGAAGRVVAYEPNPDVYARLRRHLDANPPGARVDARMIALGDRPTTLELVVFGRNTGSGTLGRVPDGLKTMVRARYAVPVVVAGDDAATWDGGGRPVRLIKIDAEGSETRICQGLRPVLEAHRPVVVTEVNRFALDINGSSPRELRDTLCSMGYRCWSLDVQRKGLASFDPLLSDPPALDTDALHDLVWVHPGGHGADLPARFLRADRR